MVLQIILRSITITLIHIREEGTKAKKMQVICHVLTTKRGQHWDSYQLVWFQTYLNILFETLCFPLITPLRQEYILLFYDPLIDFFIRRKGQKKVLPCVPRTYIEKRSKLPFLWKERLSNSQFASLYTRW